MFAQFDCWLPERPRLTFWLTGDTPDDVAWSLVEAFEDSLGASRPPHPDRHAPYPVPAPAELDRALSRALAYEQVRFTDAWWERQEWWLVDRLSLGTLGKTRLAHFRAMFPPEALLSLHLAEMVGGHFAPVYGAPERPLDGAGAIAYFERNRCLKPVTAADLAAWTAG